MAGMRGLGGVKQEKTPEVEEVTFGKKVSRFKNRFKLGQHHKMERFTIVLGSTLMLLVGFLIAAFTVNQVEARKTASERAEYTKEFEYSLSGNSGEVSGVYGDKDKTDVIALFKMRDAGDISIDAKNYEVFVSGIKGPLKDEVKPKVSYSLFGSTGYGMIRFQSKNGMPLANNILEVTIRSNANIKGVVQDPDEETAPDKSFRDFDQARIIVNPGADDVKVFKALKKDETDPIALYRELVAVNEEKVILDDIDKKITEMDTLLKRTKEYEDRIKAAGFVPPALPKYIEGDAIREDKGRMKLYPGTVIKESHNLDINSKTIRDGYVNQILSDFSQYDDYMDSYLVLTEEERESASEEQVMMPTTVKSTYGKDIDLQSIQTGKSSSDKVAMRDAVESLTAAWQQYISLKRDVEVGEMDKLFVLDADTLSQGTTFTTNNKDILFY